MGHNSAAASHLKAHPAVLVHLELSKASLGTGKDVAVRLALSKFAAAWLLFAGSLFGRKEGKAVPDGSCLPGIVCP